MVTLVMPCARRHASTAGVGDDDAWKRLVRTSSRSSVSFR